jgi:hypothetical protein
MKIIETTQENATIEMSRDELLIVNAALNEVCHGIEIFEFETRIGARRDHVSSISNQINLLLDAMKAKKSED